MSTRHAKALFASLVLGLVVVGCRPKEGGSCRRKGPETCVDGKSALVCHGGAWEPMTCRGPAGCRKVGSEAECDQTVAEDSDVCNLQGDVVCAGDHKAMLECKQNHWARTASCLGQNGPDFGACCRCNSSA